MKFLVDENVYTCLKFVLDAKGHDAQAVSLLRGPSELWSDERVMQEAAKEGRVVITFNTRDFEQLHRQYQAAEQRHPGIVVCATQSGYADFHKVLHWMDRMLAIVAEAEFPNSLRDLHTF